MKISFNKKDEKMLGKLDEGLDTLKAIKKHLESFEEDNEASVTMQLKMSIASFKDKQQDSEDAMINMMKLIEDQKEETEEAVAQWKAKRFKNKLEKRAHRAEEYASACITLAGYYADKAEIAVLRAITARQDANIAKK